MSEKQYHRLLERQLRRFVKPGQMDGLESFLESISQFYVDAENERRLLERTLDINSKELEEANKILRQKHEEMHNSILNALNVGLFATNFFGKIIFANESAKFIAHRQDIVGMDVSGLVQSTEIDDIIEYGIAQGKVEGEGSIQTEYMAVPISFSATEIRHNSETTGYVFSIQDLSREQKREELINLQQLALESTTTMMVIADNDGAIQYANGEYLRFSGYDFEELIGEDERFILDPKINSELLVQECWEKVKQGEMFEGEVLAQKKNGDVYFEDLSLTPLIQKGKITHYVAVKKDISERVRAQEELKMARDEAIMAMNQAKEANRAKDTFLSSMSHELRTPLNAIIGFSQILMAKSDTPAATKTFVEKIMISGKSLLSLVNTILDFSKIEAGKMEIHLAPFFLKDLIDEVRILIEPMVEKKNLHLMLPNSNELILDADRQLIKQVLVNLLTNAIKFSQEGKTVEIECQKLEHHVQIAIIDQGLGIPKDKIASLFDPFVQIREHQSDSIKGTGLGLSIVKKIVELHAGEIWVESVVGEGSHFCFTIPLAHKCDI